MPTSWKRADTNVLRAHLQEALAEREDGANAGECSYSDYEVEAIRAELDEREAARAARRSDVVSSDPNSADRQAGLEPESSVVGDLERIRVLIGRCFKPSRRADPSMWEADPSVEERLALRGLRRIGKGPSRHFARLQQLL